MSMKDLDAATQLVHAGRDWDPEWGYVNPPVVRASTVLHKSCEDMMDRVHDEMACRDGKPCYGSYGGPAHKAFYSAMKTLEGPNAAGAWAFSTGQAATTTPMSRSEWPAMYLVAACTTMSTPWSSGLK